MMIMRPFFYLLFFLAFLAAGLLTGAFMLLAILTMGGIFLGSFIHQKITGRPSPLIYFHTFEQRGSTPRGSDAPKVIEAEYEEIKDKKSH